MRKLLALILALIMALSLCACGGDASVRGDQIDNNTENESVGEESFSLGQTTGLTYESKFIGIGCSLPEGWSFFSDEEIKEINNVAADMAGEEYQKQMEEATVVYDMYATSSDGMSNMNVNLEKVNPVQLLVLDVEENLLKLAPTLQETMENMGYENYTYETGTVTIGDEEFVCLNTTAELYEMVMHQTLIQIKCSGYIANITITTIGEDSASSILDGFYIVE